MRHQASLLIVVAVLCAGLARGACNPGREEETRSELDSTTCDWYADEPACCSTTDVSTVEDESAGSAEYCGDGRKPLCREQLRLLFCGEQCSTGQSLWTEFELGVPKEVIVCKRFAEQIYRSCSDSEVLVKTGTFSTKCVTVDQAFANAQAFVEQLSTRPTFVVSTDDNIVEENEKCLNAGVSMVSSVFLAIAGTLVAVL